MSDKINVAEWIAEQINSWIDVTDAYDEAAGQNSDSHLNYGLCYARELDEDKEEEESEYEVIDGYEVVQCGTKERLPGATHLMLCHDQDGNTVLSAGEDWQDHAWCYTTCDHSRDNEWPGGHIADICHTCWQCDKHCHCEADAKRRQLVAEIESAATPEAAWAVVEKEEHNDDVQEALAEALPSPVIELFDDESSVHIYYLADKYYQARQDQGVWTYTGPYTAQGLLDQDYPFWENTEVDEDGDPVYEVDEEAVLHALDAGEWDAAESLLRDNMLVGR